MGLDIEGATSNMFNRVDGIDYVEDGNLFCLPGQCKAAADAAL